MEETEWLHLKVLELGVLMLVSLVLGLSPLLLPRLAERYSDSSRILHRLSLTLSSPASPCRLQLSQGLRCLTAGILLAVCLLDLLPESARQIFLARRQLGLTSTFPLLEFFLSVGFLAMLLAEQGMLAWLESAGDRVQRAAGDQAGLERARARYTLPTLTPLAPDRHQQQEGAHSLHLENQNRSDSDCSRDQQSASMRSRDQSVGTAKAAEGNSAEHLSAVRKLREAFMRCGVLLNTALPFIKVLNSKTDDDGDEEVVEMQYVPRDSCHKEDMSIKCTSDCENINMSESSQAEGDIIEDTKVSDTSIPQKRESREECTGDLSETDPTSESCKERRDHSTTSNHEANDLERRGDAEEDTSQTEKTSLTKLEPRAEKSTDSDLERHGLTAPTSIRDLSSECEEASGTQTPASSLLTLSSTHATLSNRGDNPHVQSALRSAVLVAALCFHVFFEGVALTLTSTKGQVISFSGALIFHRCMVSLSLGERLRVSQLSLPACLASLLLFALASPLGLAVALGVGRWASAGGASGLAQGGLLGMACGTLLYLVLFEVLPYELLGEEGDRFVNILCVIIGYSVIVVVLLFRSIKSWCLDWRLAAGPN